MSKISVHPIFFVLPSVFALLACSDEPGHIRKLRQACEAGDGESCNNLGLAYAEGEIVDRDFKKATYFIEKACENGHFHSCFEIAYFYERGMYVEKDFDKAVDFLKQSCNEGISEGCNRLMQLHKTIARNNDECFNNKNYEHINEKQPIPGKTLLDGYENHAWGRNLSKIGKQEVIRDCGYIIHTHEYHNYEWGTHGFYAHIILNKENEKAYIRCNFETKWFGLARNNSIIKFSGELHLADNNSVLLENCTISDSQHSGMRLDDSYIK